jgi:hypothetical protein
MATKPFPPTVLREKVAGKWALDGEYLGGSRLFIVDFQNRTRLSLELKDALPNTDFDKYVDKTTAGPKWGEFALSYFLNLNEKPHFCARTWWGYRILIDLTGARLISTQEDLLEELNSTEGKTVMDRLGAGVALMKGKKFRYLYEIEQTLAAVYWAGRMNLKDAIPLLQQLEESDYIGSCSFLPMSDLRADEINPSNHCVYQIRRAVQLALRQMGIKPAGYPSTTISDDSKNYQHEDEAARQKRLQSRVDSPAIIQKGMKVHEVLDKLGPPDYVERWLRDDVAWRYDVDAIPSFSSLVVVDQREVKSVEKWEPALWHGNDLISANVKRHVFEPDGSIVNAEIFRANYGKVDPSDNLIERQSKNSGLILIFCILVATAAVVFARIALRRRMYAKRNENSS